MNGDPDIELVLFRGFAGSSHVCVAGRVMRRSHLVPTQQSLRWRRRLRDAWRLLVSRRVPATRIELRHGDRVWQTLTDGHGYFFSCHPSPSPPDAHWSRYQARLLDSGENGAVAGANDVLHAPAEADYLVISDIDDTIVYTGVANKLRMLWRMYLARGRQRAPFPGMGAFLRELHQGPSGRAHNPIVYVSRSPWSLYPTLEEFFQDHRLPIGPVLLLRDWVITLRHPFPRRAEDHKASMIDRVLHSAPDLPVILIGDSGQHDPETYAAAVQRHAPRVLAVYIRDLSLSAGRSRELVQLGSRLEASGVRFLAANNTRDMAEHAAAQGWIGAGKRQAVQRDAEHDEV